MSLSPRKKFNGLVMVSGKPCCDFVTPRIDDRRLSLYRTELKQHGAEMIELIATEGPHIETWCITTSALISVSKGLDYHFSGPHLGTKQSLYGYAAADVGSGIREIEEIAFRMTFGKNHTEFLVSGMCGGLLDPNWPIYRKQPRMESFSVQFVVPDNEIAAWCGCGEMILKQKTHYGV